MMIEICKTLTISIFWFLMATVALSLLLHILVGFVKKILEFIDELRNK